MRLDGADKNIMSVACFFPFSFEQSSLFLREVECWVKKMKIPRSNNSCWWVQGGTDPWAHYWEGHKPCARVQDAGVVSDLGSGTANKISVCIASEDALWSRISINDGTGIAAESNQRIACVWQGFRSKFCLWCVVRAYLDFNARDENLSLLHSGE